MFEKFKVCDAIVLRYETDGDSDPSIKIISTGDVILNVYGIISQEPAFHDIWYSNGALNGNSSFVYDITAKVSPLYDFNFVVMELVSMIGNMGDGLIVK